MAENQDRNFTVITSDSLQRSIARAKELKPKAKVRILSLENREFLVESGSTEGNLYLVSFDVVTDSAGREIRAKCERVNPDTLAAIEQCKGFKYAGRCYHISAAAGVNVGIRQMRSENAKWGITK